MSLLVNVRRTGERDKVVLAGTMTEGTERDLEPLLDDVGIDCTFDFDAVTAINSCGVAEWIAFFRQFSPKRLVIFERCPPIMVDLMNMAAAFKGRAVVRSVWIPFECESCSTPSKALYEMKPDAGEELRRMTAKCKKCGESMPPACDAETYFRFTGDD